MSAVTARRRGSRVSPRRRGNPRRRDTTPTAAEDRRRFWIYVYDPQCGLMVSDGVTYIGRRLADREAGKLARYCGQPAEARPSPRA